MGINLGEITTTVKEVAPGIIIYAKSDLGKSTFLSRMVKDVPDSVLFQCGESSLSNLLEEDKTDVPHHPVLLGVDTRTEEEKNEKDADSDQPYLDFCQLLTELNAVDESPYNLIAFDNLDNIINKNVTQYVINKFYEGDVASANGWGNKKVEEITQQTELIIEQLTSLRQKGVVIVLTFHNRIIPHKDPLGEEYGMYTFNLPANSRGSVRELFINWATEIMFGTVDVTTIKTGQGKTAKSKATSGQRVLMCAPHPAYEVKNKFRFPDKMSFDYETFKKYMWEEDETEEKEEEKPKTKKKGKK